MGDGDDDGAEVFRPQPEDVSDWAGQRLRPAIRTVVDVGHIVRIQVSRSGSDGNRWTDTPYVRVTDRVGDRLAGVVDDPYRSEYSPLSNGRKIAFERADVTEIPLDWPGNETLAARAEHTGEARDVTGYIAPD